MKNSITIQLAGDTLSCIIDIGGDAFVHGVFCNPENKKERTVPVIASAIALVRQQKQYRDIDMTLFLRLITSLDVIYKPDFMAEGWC